MKDICRLLLFHSFCISTLAGAQAGATLADAKVSTWTAPATNLMWTKKDNGSDVNWNQAKAYCSNLHLAGYGGWRLPTIKELQDIYDPSVNSPKLYDDRATFNVHVKGNLNLTGWDWSSSQVDASGQSTQQGWLLNFGQEGQAISFPLGFSFSGRALCVRHSDK